jgi:ribosomal protein L29
MEDLKKVQEFFSKPMGEGYYEFDMEDEGPDYNSISSLEDELRRLIRFSNQSGSKGVDAKIEQLKQRIAQLKNQINEEQEDPTDIIAMDVPLFLRMLEYAREDAEQDIDLHKVTERAIEAVKLRGLLSMEDYNDLIGKVQQVDEIRLIPKDQIAALAAKLAAQIFSKRQDNKPAIDILKKALEDAYRALDPEVEIKEDDVEETTRLGEGVIYEELCPKGKAYITKRKAAGEKSSAYLSGRAVKVCKGQMQG